MFDQIWSNEIPQYYKFWLGQSMVGVPKKIILFYIH